jgi:hypothetical protein
MKATLKIIHWTPRILCILAIAFIGLFAMDSFDPRFSVQDQILHFMLHSIPAIILILFLITAWKWELIGGMIFMIIGIGFSPIIFSMNYQMNGSAWMSLGIIACITIPFILIGALFILSHFLKKKQGSTDK